MTSHSAATRDQRRPLHLGFAFQPGGSWPGGWRLGAHDPFNPNDITSVAQTAERAGFDFLLFSDRVHDKDGEASDNPASLPRNEPFSSASFIATRTKDIGIVVTANTSYSEPFNLARLTASLDHVTHGRAGWNVTTGHSHPLAHNFSKAEPNEQDHYDRATEVVGVIRQLWDSWEDDAFIRDKATGKYVDGDKIHPVNHQGALFSIKGPLNVARPPQGQLIIAHDVVGAASISLAAAEADLALVGGDEPEATISTLRTELAKFGRKEDDIITFVPVTVVIGETTHDAEQIRDQLVGLTPNSESKIQGTIIVGDAVTIVDSIESVVDQFGADGVIVHVAFLPDQLERFASLVTPELKKRGLLNAPDAGTSLRRRLNLATVANRLVAAA